MSCEGVQKVGLSGCVYCRDDELTDFGSCWNGGIPLQKVLPQSPDASCLLEEIIKNSVSLWKEMVLQSERSHYINREKVF